MKKDELYSKLQKVDKTMLKRMGMSLEELKYLQKKVLNDQLGLKLNFSEMDNEEKYNYLVLSEEEDLSFNVNGEGKSNLLIEGDNYHALKALKTAGTKVEVIYIDPPYNTGKEFIYNDDFGNDPKIVGSDDAHKHSKWLSFMKKRLTIAKELLTDDGVVFVSIDDNEQSYLKVLLDEVFGENNFISNLPRKLLSGGKNDATFYRKASDYILCYARNQNSLRINPMLIDPKKYYVKSDEYEGERGTYQTHPLMGQISYSKNNDFEINFEGENYYPGDKGLFDKRKIDGPSKKDWNWRWSKKRVDFAIENGFIVKSGSKLRTKTYFGATIAKVDGEYKVVKINRTMNPSALKYIENNDYSNNAAQSVLSRLGVKFDYSKPVNLVADLINDFQFEDDITVLDFFAGSGTTGQAVLELNERFGGTRRFILVTNNENNIARNITRERIFRVVNGCGSKGEQIKWEYSKDKKSLDGNSLKYLVVKPVDKYEGDFEEIDVEKDLYKVEFDKDIDITDFK